MHQIKKGVLLFSIISIFISCNTKTDTFLISHHNIGKLTDSTQVKDLEAVFFNDSIVKNIAGDEFLGRINDIEVFEKGGRLLLVLTPTEALDSTSTIRTIKIVDERYKTLKGLSIKSVFEDIKRAEKVVVEYQDTEGHKKVMTAGCSSCLHST